MGSFVVEYGVDEAGIGRWVAMLEGKLDFPLAKAPPVIPSLGYDVDLLAGVLADVGAKKRFGRHVPMDAPWIA